MEPLELKYNKLVKYLLKDDEQLNSLRVLSKLRGIPLKYLVKRGIFCVPDEDELFYLLEEWGLDFEDVFGKDEDNIRLVNKGFIIPVLDSDFNIIFYVNYNWERGSARKYLNVFPDEYHDLGVNMKMYGMHNMVQGVKEGWIVVVEGIFDVIRLETVGVPSVSIMGNKLLEYHKRFLNRFDKVIYVSDTDRSGQIGKNIILNNLSNVVHFPIEGLSKDVDEFANRDKYAFDVWVDNLKSYRK